MGWGGVLVYKIFTELFPWCANIAAGVFSTSWVFQSLGFFSATWLHRKIECGRSEGLFKSHVYHNPFMLLLHKTTAIIKVAGGLKMTNKRLQWLCIDSIIIWEF